VKVIQGISLFILTLLLSCAGKGDLRVIENSGKLITGRNPDLYFYEKSDNVSRSKSVEINGKVFNKDQISQGDVVIINIFDIEHTGTIVRINDDIQGTVSITFKLDTSESDYMVLSKNSGRISANMSLSGSENTYQIISDEKTGRHYLIEINKKNRDELEGGPVLIPGERKQ
jgi:hypothetical protein